MTRAIGLALTMVGVLAGCAPANLPTAANFHFGFASAGGATLHMDRAATPERRRWSTEAYVEHYWTYVGAGGQLSAGRGLDVYFHDADRIFGPRGWGPSYIVEDPDPGAARDEIHVAMGYLATCAPRPRSSLRGGLMAELHQSAILPAFRDYYYQDPRFGWPVIFGFTAPTGVWVPGLQEIVVARLEARR